METLQGAYRMPDAHWLELHTDDEIREFFLRQSPLDRIRDGQVREYVQSTLLPVFQNIPVLAREMLQIYKARLDSLGLAPGLIRAYAVGGRVQGTPPKVGSDIDMVFAGANPNRMIEQPDGVWTGQIHWVPEIDNLQTALLAQFRDVCAGFGVPYVFHIASFGQEMPQKQHSRYPAYLLCEA